MSSCSTVTTEMLLLLFRLLSVSLVSPRVFSLFLILLGGAPKIDLPLSMFSLTNTFFTSLFLDLALLLGGTITVVLVKAILGEEKSHTKSLRLEVDF